MLDETDYLILNELIANSKITMKELGKRVHMSGQAVALRIAKLEEQAIIKNYTVNLNQEKLGYPVHAILTIHTHGIPHKPYLSFLETHAIYVIHNYKTSGLGCYQLECRFPSNQILNDFLTELNQYVNYDLSLILYDTCS